MWLEQEGMSKLIDIASRSSFLEVTMSCLVSFGSCQVERDETIERFFMFDRTQSQTLQNEATVHQRVLD